MQEVAMSSSSSPMINSRSKAYSGFCNNYLELNAEEASFIQLIRLLWSEDLADQRKYISSPEDYLRGLRYRWLIFVSILMQKMILLLKSPMSNLGYLLVFWLNLVASNGGSVRQLFLNFIKGKVERTDRSMATFRSLIGNLDTRVDLEIGINYMDDSMMRRRREEAVVSFMAAKLAYESDAFIQAVVQHDWKMELLGCYNFWNDFHQKYTTQAFMAQDSRPDKNLIVVAFRGTGPFDADAWCTDIDFSWFELNGVGKIHGGFMKALGLQRNKGWPKEIVLDPSKPQFAYYTIVDNLKTIFKDTNNKDAKFILTGHSLGGALAILFVAVLILHEEAELLGRIQGVYTFGQPRVGDKEFGEFMKEKLKFYDVTYFRYVYCNDMVPRLPYDDTFLFYKHVGPCLFYDSSYRGRVLEEEPNKNYSSLLWFIPKYLNAMWELLRGFILPWRRGSSYREGRCLRAFRLIGLLIPGLADHGPQDYNNLTRIGNILPFPPQHRDSTHALKSD